MFQFSHWLGFYWLVLLPVATFLATTSHYHEQRKMWHPNQLSSRVLRWLLLALAMNFIVVGFLVTGSIYETSLWPSGGAFLAAIGIAISQQRLSVALQTRPFISSEKDPIFGLRGERQTMSRGSRVIYMRIVRQLVPFLVSLMICFYVLSQQAARWPGLWLISVAIFNPLCITIRSRRRTRWVSIVPVTLVSIAFGWYSFELRNDLPTGHWVTPMTSASCSSTVQLDMDREHAWCTDETNGQVYRFSPRTGLVDQEQYVEYSSQAFTANANQAWIMQNPVKGLVLVENGGQTQVKINLARQGAVDWEGRLWVIDVSGFLWVSRQDEEWNRIKASDGLLDNTANFVKISPDGAVWVGSVSGVSILAPGQSTWQHITRSDGLPGSVIGFAFGENGTTWYLWDSISAYQENRRWGVSSQLGSRWYHFELGAKTGLDIPSSQQAIAIDGLARVWFVAPSYKQHTIYLGILVPSSGLITLYTLGPFDLAPRGFPIPGFHGVVDDGGGGIYLYNPMFAPLRHWQPNREQTKINPCPVPCNLAKLFFYSDDENNLYSGTPNDIFHNPKEERTKLFRLQLLRP